MLNLLGSLVTLSRMNQLPWEDIKAVRLEMRFESGDIKVFSCPDVGEHTTRVLERFLEHVSDSMGLKEIVAGCIWYRNGSILKHSPNEWIGELGHWQRHDFPVMPTEDDNEGLDWFQAVYPTLR